MAAFIFSRSLLRRGNLKSNIRHFHPVRRKAFNLNTAMLLGVPVACVSLWQAWRKYGFQSEIIPIVHAGKEENEGDGKPHHVPTYREVRFKQFASVEYERVAYMTPQDFLESVTEDMPRHYKGGSDARIGRKKLTEAEIKAMLKNTSPKRRSSNNLFRSMHNKGIISYTEYLFLLCVLTKPQSGFRIAFNMFDTDGNQIVDKTEFLVLEHFFAFPRHERKFVYREPKRMKALLDMEAIIWRKLSLESVFSKQESLPSKETKKTGKEFLHSSFPETQDNFEQRKNLYGYILTNVDSKQDTTLLIHFFGPEGREVLKYNDFHRFMENLQSEVIELEFLEFSKGMPTISEEDFAHILLRYTSLDRSDVEECISRVQSRIPEEKGISFKEFKQFCQFLNSLDDFNIAMKMYTYAEQSVSQEEFQRAVFVCTGFTLGSHIVDTVFQIFDADGDGHLSYREFISIMKDRMHRGSKSQTMHTMGSWDSFRSCVKNQMKSY